jgi:4-amino-4-deoxy-L-arabinose transferase-like glycosyltransferase
VTPAATGQRRFGAEFILVAAVFLAAGSLRLNDLFYYTPDGARYLVWGNSLARGEGYLDDTQPEELRYVVHAPLYPALISPVEMLFPLGVVEVKAYTLLWGGAALLFLYLWLFRLFGRFAAFAGALAMGVNPGFLVYSTEVLSEAPFIAFLTLVLWLMARREDGTRLEGASWWALLAAASLIGLLREVGVVVTACVALRLWFTDRGKAVALVACAGAALAAWYVRNSVIVGAPPGSPGGNLAMLLRHAATPPDAPLAAELASRISSGAAAYLPRAGGLEFFPLYGPQHVLLLESPVELSAGLRLFVFAAIGGLMAAGIVRRLRSGGGGWLPVAAGAGLFLAACLYPVRDARFMAPLLPVMVMLLMAGASIPSRRAWLRAAAVAVAAAAVIVPNRAAVEGIVGMNRWYGSSPEELHAAITGRPDYPYYYLQPWSLLRGRMDTAVAPGAVLAAPAKELAVVSGGRKVLELDPGVSQAVFDRLLRTTGVTYLLSPSRWGDMRVYEELMTRSRRCVFTEAASAGNLRLYRVEYRPFYEPDRRGAGPAPAAGDAAGYLRRARASIREGRYAEAHAFVDSALRADSTRPEIFAGAVAAASLSGDSAAAAEAFARLAGLPQAGSFLRQAEEHLLLSGTARQLAALPEGEERAMRTLDASRIYWEMGYYGRARDLLAREMEGDTSFFVGHLWNFHFHFQERDTASARRSLRALDRIDAGNSLVRNFHALMDLRRSVGKSADPRRRASLRLRMAAIYRDIELFDESFDQAYAAASDDTASAEAALFLADLHAKLGYARRALGLYEEYLGSAPADSAVRARADSLAGIAGR